ncbi:MAG: hypothetical protein EZS28_053746, partial [Streblomastix strix]
NLNPTIDLFSQYFNNLLQIFMSTISEHGEIAIDALNQTWKMELSLIHPLIPLLPAVLKKIREEQIEAMIITPLWPGQIWRSKRFFSFVLTIAFAKFHSHPRNITV